MSNYDVTPFDKNHEIMVGWDAALNTYFAHVIDNAKDEEDPGRDLLWIGCKPNAIHDIEILDRAVTPFGFIPQQIVTKMYGDANG